MKNAQPSQGRSLADSSGCQVSSAAATANARREFLSLACRCAGVFAVSHLSLTALLAQTNAKPAAQNATIERRVNAVIAHHLEIKPERVVPSARLIEDLGADSLDLVELIMAFEEEFNIEIPDDDAEKFFTVQDAYDFVNRNIKKEIR